MEAPPAQTDTWKFVTPTVWLLTLGTATDPPSVRDVQVTSTVLGTTPSPCATVIHPDVTPATGQMASKPPNASRGAPGVASRMKSDLPLTSSTIRSIAPTRAKTCDVWAPPASAFIEASLPA